VVTWITAIFPIAPKGDVRCLRPPVPGNRLLQPRILGLEASGALIVVRLKGTETRLLADPVPLATTDTGSPSASRMTVTI